MNPTKFFFVFAALAALLSSPLTQASEPYYRFWRGWAKTSTGALSEYEAFLRGINDVFVPATVDLGAGRGLISYLPAMLHRKDFRPSRWLHLPDEIALVAYASESDYHALFGTAAGAKYAKMHWDYFDRMKGSGSRVPQIYAGKLRPDVAYRVLESRRSWQRGYARVAVLGFSEAGVSGLELRRYVEGVRARNTKGLLSYLVLHGGDHLIEYQLWKGRNLFARVRAELAGLRAPHFEVVLDSYAETLDPGNSDLSWAAAGNTVFSE